MASRSLGTTDGMRSRASQSPDGTDMVQKRLFEDSYRVFYDPAVRTAPREMAEYLAAEHITAVYEPQRPLDFDQWLAGQGILCRFRVLVATFAGLRPFIHDSALLATAPALLQLGLMRCLASAAVPLACPSMPMYMIWHLRHQHDPAHRWLRAELSALVPPVLAAAGKTPPETPTDAPI